MTRILFFYAASGFISLAYQVVWFRIIIDWYGSTNLAFALVICNFIGGLGAGALLSNRITNAVIRWSSLNDRLRVYGCIELLVGATALLTFLAGQISPGFLGTFPYVLDGDIWTQAAGYRIYQIVVASVVVFIPCLFMGVTFPLLCNVFVNEPKGDSFPSALYAWNTLGACTGVLACQFLLILRLGHTSTFLIMAVLNVLLGLYFLFTGGEPSSRDVRTIPEPVPDASPSSEPTGRMHYPSLLILAALSGLLAGALEGDLFKRIGFLLGAAPGATMTFISFWAILGIFLASTLVRMLPGFKLLHIKLGFLFATAYYLLAWQYREFIVINNWPVSLVGLLKFTGIYVFPPYFLISLLLPYLCNLAQAQHRHLGLAYGLNTVAFCVGLLTFTLVAPQVNIFYSTKLFIGLLILGALFLMFTRKPLRVARFTIPAFLVVLALASVFTSADFDHGYFAPESQAARAQFVRALKSNGTHTTYVLEETAPSGQSWLQLYFDNYSMSSTVISAQSYMRLMAHVPLMSLANPKKALLICFGVGNTASAIAAHSSIDQIDAVDLNHRIFETAPEFSASSNSVHLDPRLRMIHDDGRDFLNLTDNTYDLITSEPPPPMAPGVYRLYSREYYETALAHLNPQGILAQWLPPRLMSQEATDMVIGTFLDVFPEVLLFSGWEYPQFPGAGEMILIGSRTPLNLERLVTEFDRDPNVVTDLKKINIRSGSELMMRVLADDATLRRKFASKGVISDQRNQLEQSLYDPMKLGVVHLD